MKTVASLLLLLLLLPLMTSMVSNAQTHTVRYRYDAQGRLTRAAYSGEAFSASRAITYQYDAGSSIVRTEAGEDTGVAIEATDDDIPTTFELYNNYPNPFNPQTTIRFDVPEASIVRLIVYDVTGREIASLIDGDMAPGRHLVTFDAGQLASGLYFYRIDMGDFRAVRKMVLVK